MAITPEHVGRSYPPTEPYEITLGKSQEFAAVLGAGSDEVPPTFAAVLATRAWEAMFADPELDLALHRIVHGDQRFSWDRPLGIGDVVTATLSIDQVRDRGSMQMITTTVTFDDADAARIGTATATFVHTPDPHPAEDR